MDQSDTPLALREVRDALNARKGEWRDIAAASGVPYSTLSKVAQGHVLDPRISTVAALTDWLRANPRASEALRCE